MGTADENVTLWLNPAKLKSFNSITYEFIMLYFFTFDAFYLFYHKGTMLHPQIHHPTALLFDKKGFWHFAVQC